MRSAGSPPIIAATICLIGVIGKRVRAHEPAVTQHGGDGADAVELLQPVADVEDAAAGPLQLADHVEQPVELLRRRAARTARPSAPPSRRRRGPWQSRRAGDPRPPAVRPSCGARTAPTRPAARPHLVAAVPYRRTRTCPAGLPAAGSRPPTSTARDPAPGRCTRSRPAGCRAETRTRRRAPESQLPGIGGDRAHDDLHERALAGPVLADKAVDLARQHREVHAVSATTPGNSLRIPVASRIGVRSSSIGEHPVRGGGVDDEDVQASGPDRGQRDRATADPAASPIETACRRARRAGGPRSARRAPARRGCRRV